MGYGSMAIYEDMQPVLTSSRFLWVAGFTVYQKRCFGAFAAAKQPYKIRESIELGLVHVFL